MAKKDAIEVEGTVVEALPGGKFKIQLEDGPEITGHLAGKLRMFKIMVLPGDKVRVEMTPYDLTKGRITFRL